MTGPSPKAPNSQVPAPEIIAVDSDADGVSCDGGGGALGHPKVWYSFDAGDEVECGYCDRLFAKGR
ncbi:MAG: zinc-finger domain-containing protein [Alphaproteobacteria bacterium]